MTLRRSFPSHNSQNARVLIAAVCLGLVMAGLTTQFVSRAWADGAPPQFSVLEQHWVRAMLVDADFPSLLAFTATPAYYANDRYSAVYLRYDEERQGYELWGCQADYVDSLLGLEQQFELDLAVVYDGLPDAASAVEAREPPEQTVWIGLAKGRDLNEIMDTVRALSAGGNPVGGGSTLSLAGLFDWLWCLLQQLSGIIVDMQNNAALSAPAPQLISWNPCGPDGNGNSNTAPPNGNSGNGNANSPNGNSNSNSNSNGNSNSNANANSNSNGNSNSNSNSNGNGNSNGNANGSNSNSGNTNGANSNSGNQNSGNGNSNGNNGSGGGGNGNANSDSGNANTNGSGGGGGGCNGRANCCELSGVVSQLFMSTGNIRSHPAGIDLSPVTAPKYVNDDSGRQWLYPIVTSIADQVSSWCHIRFAVIPSDCVGRTALFRLRIGGSVVGVAPEPLIAASTTEYMVLLPTSGPLPFSTVQQTSCQLVLDVSVSNGPWVPFDSMYCPQWYVMLARSASSLSGMRYDLLLDVIAAEAGGCANAHCVAENLRSYVSQQICYDPSVKTVPPLVRYVAETGTVGQCTTHARVLKYLCELTGIPASVNYHFAGITAESLLLYDLTNVPIPETMQLRLPANEGGAANPHFAFHAYTYAGGSCHDPTYGRSGPAEVIYSCPDPSNDVWLNSALPDLEIACESAPLFGVHARGPGCN